MRYFFIAIIAGVLLYRNVYAYIDPGTGSYFFQLILGLVFGISLTSSSVYRGVSKAFRFLKTKLRRPKTEHEEHSSR